MPYYFHIHKDFDEDPGAMTDWINRFEKALGRDKPFQPGDLKREPPYDATPAGRINIGWDPEANVDNNSLDFDLYIAPGHRYEIPDNDRASAEALYDAIKKIGSPSVDLSLTERTRTVPALPPDQVEAFISMLMEEQGLSRKEAEAVAADLSQEREVVEQDPTVWTRKAEGPPKPVRGRRLTFRHTPENVDAGIAGKEKYPEGKPWEQTQLWKDNIDTIYTKDQSVNPSEWRRMYRAWRNKTAAQRIAQKIYNESAKGITAHERYDESDKANIGYWDEEAGVFKIGARKKYRTGPKGKKAVAKAQVNQRLRTTRSRELARQGMGGYQIEITLWKEGLYPGFKSLERFITKKLKAEGIINPYTGEEYPIEGEGYPSENYDEGDNT